MNLSPIVYGQIDTGTNSPPVFNRAKNQIQLWTAENSTPEEVDRCRRVGYAFVDRLEQSYLDGEKTPQKVLSILAAFPISVKLSLSDFEPSEMIEAIQNMIENDGKNGSIKPVQEMIQDEFDLCWQSVIPFADDLIRLLEPEDLLNFIDQLNQSFLNEYRDPATDKFIKSWLEKIAKLPNLMAHLEKTHSNKLRELFLNFLDPKDPLYRALIVNLAQKSESFFLSRLRHNKWTQIENEMILAGVLQCRGGLLGLDEVIQKRKLSVLRAILAQSKTCHQNQPSLIPNLVKAIDLANQMTRVKSSQRNNSLEISRLLMEHLEFIQHDRLPAD